MVLVTTFSFEEEQELNLWRDENLIIYSTFDSECFISNDSYGKFSYEQCFGEVQDEKLEKLRYEKANPRRIIKYLDFYLMEDKNELGHWFLGWLQKNNNIEFLSGHESLSDAFDSL